jgi:hypothetical protein
LFEIAAQLSEANEINCKIRDDNRAYIESELKKANALIAKLGKETELLSEQIENLGRIVISSGRTRKTLRDVRQSNQSDGADPARGAWSKQSYSRQSSR